MKVKDFSSVLHIATIRNNFIILITLSFTLVVILMGKLNDFDKTTQVKELFVTETLNRVLNKPLASDSTTILYQKSGTQHFKYVELEFSDPIRCVVRLRDETEKTCDFFVRASNDLRTMLSTTLATAGYCFEKQPKWTFYPKEIDTTCPKEFLLWGTIKHERNLTELDDFHTNQPSIIIDATVLQRPEKFSGSYIRGAYINNLDVIDKSGYMRAEDLPLYSDELLLQEMAKNYGVDCGDNPITSIACYYVQLNNLIRKFSANAENIQIPYLTQIAPIWMTCVVILLTMFSVVKSMDTASQIAVKSIKSGLAQNCLPLDCHDEKLASFFFSMLTILTMLSVAASVLIIVPFGVIYEFVIFPISNSSGIEKFLYLIAVFFNYLVSIVLPLIMISPVARRLKIIRMYRQKELWNSSYSDQFVGERKFRLRQKRLKVWLVKMLKISK